MKEIQMSSKSGYAINDEMFFVVVDHFYQRVDESLAESLINLILSQLTFYSGLEL